MRILACSDLHGNFDIYNWIVTLVNELNPKLLILAGDLFGFSGCYNSVDLAHENEAKHITKILSKISIPTVFIMGNDDFIHYSPELINIHHIQSSYFKYNNYNFIGYEYSLPFIGGIYEKPESEIEKDLQNLSDLIVDKSIFITHSPAYGILDKSSLGIHCGSSSILTFIYKHNIYAHIHGHVHESFGNEGIHFNCASGGNKRAILINLDNLKFDFYYDKE